MTKREKFERFYQLVRVLDWLCTHDPDSYREWVDIDILREYYPAWKYFKQYFKTPEILFNSIDSELNTDKSMYNIAWKCLAMKNAEPDISYAKSRLNNHLWVFDDIPY
jgi:hypothetical protein